MGYNEQFNLYLTRFEAKLNSFLNSLDKTTPNIIRESITYSLLNGGKRIRPVLCYATADALGVSLDKVDNFALAIEFIHSYSLVHDDLPAMDNDDYRRGKLSTHKKFGEAYGILAGDALLNLAFETCLSKYEFSKNDLRATSVVAEYAGYRGMISGQVWDLLAETTDFSQKSVREQYDALKEIFINKTSKLLTAPLLVASELADKKCFETLKEFGTNLGIMFQITDDILDVEGSLETIGKTPNKDKEANKLTAVKIFGVDGAKTKANDLYNKCKELLALVPNNEFLLKFTDKIYFRKK